MSTTAFALEAADERAGVRYAGFGLRLAAGLVDLLVFAPLIALGFWATHVGPATAIAYSIIHEVAYFAYTIVGHARWGQTIGKGVVGIRVLDLSGRRIGWRQAVRRSSVDIVLGILAVVTYWLTIVGIPATELAARPWPEVHDRYVALRPWWAAAVEYVYFAWLGSEVVSVLFNRRRRALHDFIAGTVVVSERPEHLPPLRGWRRVLGVADVVVMGIALVLAVVTAIGASTLDAAGDATARRALWGFALYNILVAGACGAAARALRRQGRWHWALHALVMLLVLVAAALPLLP
jgi:uncharacterized RDD family membrane protein YckC